MKLTMIFLFFCATLPQYAEVDNYSDYIEHFAAAETNEEPLESFFHFPDLEEWTADFILETKQIHINEYPDAFNPTIARFQGSLLLCFRTYDAKTRATDKIGLCFLDEKFNPVGPAQLLNFKTNDPFSFSKRQDPRLITVGNRLFIIYNNVMRGNQNKEIRRMLAAEVFFDGSNFYAEPSDCFLNFEGENKERSEKNWTPFEYNNDLLFCYSIFPHKIIRPILGTSDCQTTACTFGNIKWPWGVIRGGTPALLTEKGEYLSFFHSSKSMATVHSKGKNMLHYFMGAYTFSSVPPFEVTSISAQPIVGKNFYNGPAHKTWKPLIVVFPGGFVMNDEYIWMVYGRQDHELWVAKLDKQLLFDNLTPVSNVKIK